MNLFRKQDSGQRAARRDWMAYFDEWLDEWPHIKQKGFNLSFSPAVNLKEAEDEYVIEAELPGMGKEEIDLTIKGTHLVMRGEKKTFEEESRKDYKHVERTYGSFYRTIPLASDADTENISADYQNGVLEVHIGKVAEGQISNRKVQIQ